MKVQFTQLWTSHNTAYEGGRKTHATLDGERPACGTNLGDMFATCGEERSEERDRISDYVDCARCIKLLRRQEGGRNG